MFASLLSREPAPMLGVDVSASSVKVVELARTRSGQLVVERCASEVLERGWVTDGNIEKFDEVANAVRRAVRKSGSKTKNAALALPASAVITKKITLPADLTEDETEIQVESEANQYIPFSLDDVSLDFCILGPSGVNPMDVDVLIAASRKEKVQDRQGLAEAAGLKAVIVDIESHASRRACERLMQKFPHQKVVALIKIGAYSTNLQVMSNSEVLYERDQAFGGAQLSQLISRQYGFTLEEAEQRKRSDDLPSDYEWVILKSFVVSVGQEVVRALQFFFTSHPQHRIDQVFLAGGTAAVKGLTEEIRIQAKLSCAVINPFEYMEFSSSVRSGQMLRQAPSYLTATGLALRRFLQ